VGYDANRIAWIIVHDWATIRLLRQDPRIKDNNRIKMATVEIFLSDVEHSNICEEVMEGEQEQAFFFHESAFYNGIRKKRILNLLVMALQNRGELQGMSDE
jgi:hypothetical protein